MNQFNGTGSAQGRNGSWLIRHTGRFQIDTDGFCCGFNLFFCVFFHGKISK